jgi:tetratricopeptide (TPR) repeat protein
MTGSLSRVPVDGGVVPARMVWPRVSPFVTFPVVVRLLLCALVTVSLVGSSEAQRGEGPQPSHEANTNLPWAIGAYYDGPLPDLASAKTAGLLDAEACSSWTEYGVRSPTVSTARLAVPEKASSEYQKGCGDYKDKKFVQSEEHLRKAIAVYADYAAAWVLLGQALDAQQKRPEARKACSQASSVDPKYVAPYLCLAELSAAESDWEQVARLAERALELDPVRNIYSFYYAAYAGVHLRRFREAETSALAALQLDRFNFLPQLHLLLAQVYAEKGDGPSEMAELREFLRLAPNSDDAAGAKNTLAEIESGPPK